MKNHKKLKKMLVGSVSISSTIALVSTVLLPTIFVNTPNNNDYIDLNQIHWDIIVPDNIENIQTAINTAKPGDKILVKNGTYTPTNKWFDRTLEIKTPGITICGQNPRSTIINGRGTYTVISIEAPDIHFIGFTIIGNSKNGTLMNVQSNHANISYNIFETHDYSDGTEYALELHESQNTTVSHNKISNSDYGIILQGCQNNQITHNLITNTNAGICLTESYLFDLSDGININRQSGSTQNKITHNQIIDVRDGISLYRSSNNQIKQNQLIQNGLYGIELRQSTENTVESNTFIDSGLNLAGRQITHFIHNIKNNTVNNKPLYYQQSLNSFSAPQDVGQIILVGCSQGRIEGVQIANTTNAVFLVYCSDIIITNCDFRYNAQGLNLQYSNRNTITKNNFIRNTINAAFTHVKFIQGKSNTWRNNYWENLFGSPLRIFRILPKRIPGRIFLQRRSLLFNRVKYTLFGIPTGDFDWRPAKTPHILFLF